MQRGGRSALWALVAMQFAGLVMSALLFGVTFAQPEQVTARLQGFAVAKVETLATGFLDGAEAQAEEGGALAGLAARLASEAGALDAAREKVVPQLVAYALSDDCGDTCVPAMMMAAITNISLVERAANLRVGETTAKDFIAQRYQQTLAGLISDLRGFGAVNVIAFALMIGLVAVRQLSNWRFVTFSVALFGFTLYMTHWYLFGQDWAQVILFQNWAAGLYQGAMIFACLVMIDWLFLRAFFTRLAGNAIGSIGV